MLFEQQDEGTDDVRIELRAGPLTEAPRRLLHRQAATVRPVGGHGVEGVADEDDARLERDELAGELVRIPAAVPPLVTMAHDRADVLQAVDRRDDPLAELGVRLDHRALLDGEVPGLGQDLGRDADLADVVEERAELEPLERLRIEPECSADLQRRVGDPARVRRRVLVVRLERVRQRLDGRDERALEVLEVVRVRDRELRLVREAGDEPERALEQIRIRVGHRRRDAAACSVLECQRRDEVRHAPTFGVEHERLGVLGQ